MDPHLWYGSAALQEMDRIHKTIVKKKSKGAKTIPSVIILLPSVKL